MSSNSDVTDASAFDEKSLGIQVVLAIITVGFYTLYWFYSTGKQLDRGTDANVTPLLGIIPVVNLIAAWQIAGASEAVTDQNQIIMFILFIVLPLIPWYWIQSGMNDVATA